MKIEMLVISGVLFFVGLTIAQNTNTNDDDECPAQWLNFAQCLREQRRQEMETAGLSTPTDDQRRQLESNVKACFHKFNCRDPVTSDDETRARLDCFRKSQTKLRSELQECVKNEINGFTLPEDNFGNGDPWKAFLVSVNMAVKNYRAYCSWSTSQNDLRRCVESGLTDYIKKKNPANNNNRQVSNSGRHARNYCEMRAKCKQNANNQAMNDNCESEWRRRAVPQLCTCGQDMKNRGRLRAFQNEFTTCMSQQHFRVNANNESAFTWFDNGVESWCTRSTNQQRSGDRCSNTQKSVRGQNQGFQGRSADPDDQQSPPPQGQQGPTPNNGNGNNNWFFSTQPSSGNGGGNDDDVPPPPDNQGGPGSGPQGGPQGPPPNGNPFGGGLAGLFGNGLFGAGSGGSVFGNNAGNLGNGGAGGGNGELFGGLLNGLGMGNPFDGGGILGQFASLANVFQTLLSGFSAGK